MVYSIVDIETTGGSPVFDRIVEIGIIRIEKGEITDQFQSLIHPERHIPGRVSLIHGISNEMVSHAPTFEDLADQILTCLADSVFVAHSVNFDFSFLKESFRRSGRPFDLPKLCTVKLGKKLLPHLKSHSLAALCGHYQIWNKKAHRALEDAEATARIFLEFQKIAGFESLSQHFLKRSGKGNKLPPNLSEAELEKLPSEAGVYLFHNKAGKVLYVGKAINLKDRVMQHFRGHTHTRTKSAFLEEIHHVSYQLCGHELMAFLVENALIKEHFPRYNSTNKEFRLPYGIFSFVDQQQITRLVVGQAGKWSQPERVFKNKYEAVNFLLKLSLKYGLCLKLNQLTDESKENCRYKNSDGLTCILCKSKPEPALYEDRLSQAMTELNAQKASFYLVMKGRNSEESGMVLVLKGKIRGYGFIETQKLNSLNSNSASLHPYYDTQDSQSILYQYLDKLVPTGLYIDEVPVWSLMPVSGPEFQ